MALGLPYVLREQTMWAPLNSSRCRRQATLGLGLAALLLALTLGAGSPTSPASDSHSADVSPFELCRSIDRLAQIAYARGVRFANHIRLLVAVRALLEAPPADVVEAAPSPAPGQKTPTDTRGLSRSVSGESGTAPQSQP
jgi:hypothetical protein